MLVSQTVDHDASVPPPEPELSPADLERCAKLAEAVSQLSTLAHSIRATLAEAAPQKNATLDCCAPYVLGEWEDEVAELVPLPHLPSAAAVARRQAYDT